MIFELSVADLAGFLLDRSGRVTQAKGAAPIKAETDLEDFVDWIVLCLEILCWLRFGRMEVHKSENGENWQDKQVGS